MMQPPIELQAVAALLREEGISCELRQPGSPELPLHKAPIWRIQCHAYNNEFAISVIGDQISIVRIVEFTDTDRAKEGRPPCLGYEGTIGDFSTTPYTAKRKNVELADPDSPRKVVYTMRDWK